MDLEARGRWAGRRAGGQADRRTGGQRTVPSARRVGPWGGEGPPGGRGVWGGPAGRLRGAGRARLPAYRIGIEMDIWCVSTVAGCSVRGPEGASRMSFADATSTSANRMLPPPTPGLPVPVVTLPE